MHLPHPAILPYLPGPLLRSLHRDLCSLRGQRWGTPNPTSPFIRYHPWTTLLTYHAQVLQEFRARGFRFAKGWSSPYYRGRTTAPWTPDDLVPTLLTSSYPEHTPEYYRQSLHRALQRLQRGNWLPEDHLRLSQAPRAIP